MFSSARCEAGDERPSFPTVGEWFSSHATLCLGVQKLGVDSVNGSIHWCRGGGSQSGCDRVNFFEVLALVIWTLKSHRHTLFLLFATNQVVLLNVCLFCRIATNYKQSESRMKFCSKI